MAHTEGRWVRVPLIGDVEGIVLLLPDELLSAENWEQFMRSLDVMKPGLVAAADAAEKGQS